jgi:hypothetical protein
MEVESRRRRRGSGVIDMDRSAKLAVLAAVQNRAAELEIGRLRIRALSAGTKSELICKLAFCGWPFVRRRFIKADHDHQVHGVEKSGAAIYTLHPGSD